MANNKKQRRPKPVYRMTWTVADIPEDERAKHIDGLKRTAASILDREMEKPKGTIR